MVGLVKSPLNNTVRYGSILQISQNSSEIPSEISSAKLKHLISPESDGNTCEFFKNQTLRSSAEVRTDGNTGLHLISGSCRAVTHAAGNTDVR